VKHCPYCGIDYGIDKTNCPACQAANAETKCDNCGTVHRVNFCPNCGMGANETLLQCPKCGIKTKDSLCQKCGHSFVASGTTIKAAFGSLVAKGSCKISGHDWFGCKCKRCGETRDEQHAFQPIEEKCEQRCSVCGKIKKTPHKWQGSLWWGRECTHCGFTEKPALKRGGFWGIVGGVLFTLFIIILIAAGTASEKASKPADGTKITVSSTLATAEETTVTEAPATTTDPAQSSTAAWKQYLKNYEAWVDSYNDIIKKLNAGDITVWADYATWMDKMVEWDESADEWENELSDAEYAEFYTEYMRITAKMMVALNELD